MRKALFSVLFASLIASTAHGQGDDKPLRIFGYFQNSYEHQTESDLTSREGSFVLQQLNLFFQKDISTRWRAFVNFEFINSFASQQQWGTANLEEAWVRYRHNHYLNLKLGLQIPIFNNFNEIKNRTPLLPYVIRPLMYETSYSQLIDVSIAVPYRTFVQLYGFAPIGRTKLDYAVYLGNSPNLNGDATLGNTGRDTTVSFLVGGRVGIRAGNLKAGISGTIDRVNEETVPGESKPGLVKGEDPVYVLDRGRLGADLSWQYGPILWESEAILIDYEDPEEGFGTDARFIYGTLGVQTTERLLIYATGWLSEFNGVIVFKDRPRAELIARDAQARIDAASIGGAYNFNDRVVVKLQAAEVEISSGSYSTAFEYIASAVSVRF